MINNTTTINKKILRRESNLVHLQGRYAPRSLLHAAKGIVKWENFLKYYFREILPVNAV